MIRSQRIDPASAALSPRLRRALSEWQAAVVRLEHIDAVTTELVRLRCAPHHDCHT